MLKHDTLLVDLDGKGVVGMSAEHRRRIAGRSR